MSRSNARSEGTRIVSFSEVRLGAQKPVAIFPKGQLRTLQQA